VGADADDVGTEFALNIEGTDVGEATDVGTEFVGAAVGTDVVGAADVGTDVIGDAAAHDVGTGVVDNLRATEGEACVGANDGIAVGENPNVYEP